MAVPIRQTFENLGWKVNWDDPTQSVKLINPSGQSYTIGQNQYTMQGDRTYADPTALAGMFVGQKQSYDPQSFQNYVGIANQMYEPLVSSRTSAFQQALKNIQEQSTNQRRLAEADYSNALSGLGQREDKSRLGASHSVAGRGLSNSPLAEYERRKVTEAYAPQYQNLETTKAANLANISSQAAMGSEALAGQLNDFESEMATKALQSALGMYQQDMTSQQSNNQNIMNYLLGIGQQEKQQEQQQWQRGVTEAGLTGNYSGAPTMQRQQLDSSLASQAFRDSLAQAELTGMYNGEKTWPRQYQEGQLAASSAATIKNQNFADDISNEIAHLNDLTESYGSQTYADNYSTENGVLAPIQAAEKDIQANRAAYLANGIDPDKLIDELYKNKYGKSKAEYWKEANARLENGGGGESPRL